MTRGDLEVDAHHTVEDTSLALGQALREALGDKAASAGSATPSSRSTSAWSRRPSTCPAGRTSCTTSRRWSSSSAAYDTTLTRHVWESFVATARIALHVRVLSGRNAHHVVEAQFKAVARALRDAVALDPRVAGVPSTKGSL